MGWQLLGKVKCMAFIIIQKAINARHMIKTNTYESISICRLLLLVTVEVENPWNMVLITIACP